MVGVTSNDNENIKCISIEEAKGWTFPLFEISHNPDRMLGVTVDCIRADLIEESATVKFSGRTFYK